MLRKYVKLHISRANYVANMHVNAIICICLDYRIYYGWKQDDRVQWRDDCFPENITDVSETFDGKGDNYVSEYKFTDDEISNTSNSRKDRWCYDNVDATTGVTLCTDVNICTFNF